MTSPTALPNPHRMIRIRDRDAQASPGLVRLVLNDNAIGNEGVRVLFKALDKLLEQGQSSLRILCLSQNLISASGCKLISESKYFHHLLKIDLSKNDICLKGIRHLSKTLRQSNTSRLCELDATGDLLIESAESLFELDLIQRLMRRNQQKTVKFIDRLLDPVCLTDDDTELLSNIRTIFFVCEDPSKLHLSKIFQQKSKKQKQKSSRAMKLDEDESQQIYNVQRVTRRKGQSRIVIQQVATKAVSESCQDLSLAKAFQRYLFSDASLMPLTVDPDAESTTEISLEMDKACEQKYSIYLAAYLSGIGRSGDDVQSQTFFILHCIKLPVQIAVRLFASVAFSRPMFVLLRDEKKKQSFTETMLWKRLVFEITKNCSPTEVSIIQDTIQTAEQEQASWFIPHFVETFSITKSQSVTLSWYHYVFQRLMSIESHLCNPLDQTIALQNARFTSFLEDEGFGIYFPKQQGFIWRFKHITAALQMISQPERDQQAVVERFSTDVRVAIADRLRLHESLEGMSQFLRSHSSAITNRNSRTRLKIQLVDSVVCLSFFNNLMFEVGGLIGAFDSYASFNLDPKHFAMSVRSNEIVVDIEDMQRASSVLQFFRRMARRLEQEIYPQCPQAHATLLLSCSTLKYFNDASRRHGGTGFISYTEAAEKKLPPWFNSQVVAMTSVSSTEHRQPSYINNVDELAL